MQDQPVPPPLFKSGLDSVYQKLSLGRWVGVFYQKTWSWTPLLAMVCDPSPCLGEDLLHVESSLVSQTETVLQENQYQLEKPSKPQHSSTKNAIKSAADFSVNIWYLRNLCPRPVCGV